MELARQNQPVYLICGVSGSGKSWICRQLANKFKYIPHDEHYDNHAEVVALETVRADKPIITECPFGERLLREQLEAMGIRVIPYFVIEHPIIVKDRYEKREGKNLPKNVWTRASTIIDRALEWRAPHGTSAEVLIFLQRVTP